MRIKNIDKVKELLKEKLPDYLKELGLKIEHTKVQCPNTDAHEHGDAEKLSAAFLPQSNNTNVYCFVEDRTFDIFDVYALKQNKRLEGEGFYQAVEELAKKFGIPLEMEEEFSPKEKERKAKQRTLEALHKLSLRYVAAGAEFYRRRNISKEKLVTWQIGFIDPTNLPKELDAQFKQLYEFKLSSVFYRPGLVIPVFNTHNQYTGIIIRQFDCKKGDEYIKIQLTNNLFNIHNVRGNENITIVEGTFDAIAFYPQMNVVGCLTNQVVDDNLELLAKGNYKQITLALDPDNLYKGTARDGFLKTILKLRNFDSEIKIVEIPSEPGEDAAKPDPDEYFKKHSLEEFNALPRQNAVDYLIENYNRKLIPVEVLYQFLAGCPNLIRKEQMIGHVAQALSIGKRQLMKSIDSMTDNKCSFNLIQYTQEKDSFEELLEGFTEIAWNGNYKGVPSGFPLFDQYFGGFEDTIYIMVGFPEMGKTTFLINFVYRLARNPNNFVAFYSLDDGAKRAIVPRMLSIASGLTSKQIKEPQKNFEAEWFQGLQNLQNLKNNLVVKDGAEIKNLPDLENFIKLHNNIAQERGKKFICVIDNIHKLSYGGKREMETTQNSVKIAEYLARIPQEIGCPVICTAEVPKSASDKPTGKDIKESVDFWYTARFVGGIFSDFHNTNQKGLSPYVWRSPDGNLHPIMELVVSKNQTGDSFHGSLFYKFNRTNNSLTECTADECELLRAGQTIQ